MKREGREEDLVEEEIVKEEKALVLGLGYVDGPLNRRHSALACMH